MICTDAFLGLHIKSLINLKNFGATFAIGGQLRPFLPLATCMIETTFSRV